MAVFGYGQQQPYYGQIQQQQYVNQYTPTYRDLNAFQQQQSTLSGQMVDSIEVAKAKDIDMSGNPTFYPNINGYEIYRKQLQADGTCPTLVYRLVETQPVITEPKEEAKPITRNALNDAFSEFKDQLLEDIRSMISEPPKQTRGGAKQ